MLKTNEELFFDVYRAWYTMLNTSREMSTEKRKWEDMLSADALCK